MNEDSDLVLQSMIILAALTCGWTMFESEEGTIISDPEEKRNWVIPPEVVKYMAMQGMIGRSDVSTEAVH